MAFFFRRPAAPRWSMNSGPRRNMHAGEDPKELDKGIALWRMSSYAALAFCIAWSGWELSHHHEEHASAKTAPCMHQRRKPLPWGDGQTDLFDYFAGKHDGGAPAGAGAKHH